jgi:recombination protein RecA
LKKDETGFLVLAKFLCYDTVKAIMTTEKEKALDLAIGQIEKRFGEGSIMKLGDNTGTLAVEAIPTGSLALDLALGVGGIPRGRITEIFGPESSGKTTLAQHMIAQAQQQGGTAAYIDAEHALDPTYAGHCGIDLNELLISQPDTGEQALEITEALVRSGAVDIIVIDSVAALTPRVEIEGEMGDAHVGLQARLMSQALRKLASAISRAGTAVVFINQLREKVGVVFGNPEVTPGGRALKFYSSVRIDLRRVESLKQGNEVVGSHVRAKVVKNKVAPPFRMAEFDIMFAHGISREGNLIDLGIELGLIKKSGAFFSYGDIRLGQGRENAKQYLNQNPELAQEIEQKIKASAVTSYSSSGGSSTDD